MADKSMEHDKSHLHKMGYAQQLARRMSGFSNFAISFSIICILPAALLRLPLDLVPPAVRGLVLLAYRWRSSSHRFFVHGQIASAYPQLVACITGRQCWVDRGWGWVTAWFNVLGLFFVVSSVDVGVWLLFRDLVLVGIFKMDPAIFTASIN